MMKHPVQIFKALGDETRLRIMALLVSGEEYCVCDLMAALDLPQSTVSRHLSSLRHAGLVTDRRQGVWMYYQLCRHGSLLLPELYDLLALMLDDMEQVREDRKALAKHLAAKEKAACG
jgi:ArsR family transcriptional regulator